MIDDPSKPLLSSHNGSIIVGWMTRLRQMDIRIRWAESVHGIRLYNDDGRQMYIWYGGAPDHYRFNIEGQEVWQALGLGREEEALVFRWMVQGLR
jgi:hypothetical protein